MTVDVCYQNLKVFDMGILKYDYPTRVGETINDLTIISLYYKNSLSRGRIYKEAYYGCQCKCGNYKDIRARFVLKEIIRACKECIVKKRTKHGLTKNPLYKIWNQMMRRCYNSNDDSYKNYGARGIRVCKEWHDVRNFIRDVSIWKLKENNLLLDRIDNDGNYCLSNCRAVTRLEQNLNKRNNLKFEINGEIIIGVTGLMKLTGFKKTTLESRIRKGLRGNDLIAPIKDISKNFHKGMK